MKWAIYKEDIGYSAWIYVDKSNKNYPYIKKEHRPAAVNRVGGFHPVNKHKLVEVRNVADGKEPLTLEETCPKNSKTFELGWISPTGDTYHTPYYGHQDAAVMLCKLFKYECDYHDCEYQLEAHDWIKVGYSDGTGKKFVYSLTGEPTSEQATTLLRLNLKLAGMFSSYQ